MSSNHSGQNCLIDSRRPVGTAESNRGLEEAPRRAAYACCTTGNLYVLPRTPPYAGKRHRLRSASAGRSLFLYPV